MAECNVFPDSVRCSPTYVTRMLTAALSPSANAKRVVHHVLLMSTASGHLVMREAESLTHLRVISIGSPIAHMCAPGWQYTGGVNLVLTLASGGFIVAYPSLISSSIANL